MALSTIKTNSIDDSAITADKIANTTITGAKIANTTIEAAQIANTTITGAKIANTTIENGQIANSTIASGKLAFTAKEAGKESIWVPANAMYPNSTNGCAALAQTELQLVQSNPEVHGGPQGLYQAYRKMYEALGVSNIDQMLPPPPQPMPVNPAKENQEALRGGRLQAFPQQNHSAHIEAHLAIFSTSAAQINASIAMTLQLSLIHI